MTPRRLVADVGGTWSRFATSDGPGRLDNVRSYPTAARATFTETMDAYVADIGAAPARTWCTSVHIAAAGPVDAGVVKLTNSTWRIAATEVSRELDGVPVHVVNDLEAVGLLLPHLTAADIRQVGPVAAGTLVGNRIAVNVGTGFGAATAIRADGGRWAIAAGEAGHMSLAGMSAEETAAFETLDTIEDVLSGAGLARLHATLARRHGVAVPTASDASVFARAADDPIATMSVQLFARLLGRVCGDLVLATASWDGVFLCGSVAKAWAATGDAAAFRAAFERKGAMGARMAAVPAHVIVTSDPALRGLTHAAAESD